MQSVFFVFPSLPGVRLFTHDLRGLCGFFSLCDPPGNYVVPGVFDTQPCMLPGLGVFSMDGSFQCMQIVPPDVFAFFLASHGMTRHIVFWLAGFPWFFTFAQRL